MTKQYLATPISLLTTDKSAMNQYMNQYNNIIQCIACSSFSSYYRKVVFCYFIYGCEITIRFLGPDSIT